MPLPLPLGVAVEPLGWSALEPELAPALELGELALGTLGVLEVAPPEAEPAFSLSFSASVADELDELDAPGWVVVPDDGLVALGAELELEVAPLLGELGGGVDVALLLEPDVLGAVEVRSLAASSPQAARPRAKATATANVESLMCPPSGYGKQSSKQRAGCKPLISQGLAPARGTLCLVDGTSYLLPDGLDGAPEGLVERFGAALGSPLGGVVVDPEPAVLPPDASRLASRSHPANSAPESANETAAANAVAFMLTSVVGVNAWSNLWTTPSSR